MKIVYLNLFFILLFTSMFSQGQGDWVDSVRKPYVYQAPVSIKILPKTDPKRPYDFVKQTNIRGDATGFFHTQKINNKWWMIDPAGYGFYMVSMLGGVGHRWGQGAVTYTTNVEAKYGTQEKFWDAQVSRLKSWGYNTWGYWGVEPLAAPMPTVRQLEPMATFISWQTNGLSTYKLIDGVDWHDVANVFHPEWKSWVNNYIKQMVTPFANSPWIIGYQIGNETDWNLVNTAALSAWKRPMLDEAKKAWIDVAKCHGDINYFNTAWKTNFQTFEEVGTTKTIPSKAPTPEAEAMCWDFNNLVLEKFFKPCREAINQYAPNHLVMGVRQHAHTVREFFNAGFWETMGKYCDVISLNYYSEFVNPTKGVPTTVETHLRGIHELTKRPIMISEWHPRGNVAENEPYTKYNIYQKYMASLDFMVGTQFFQLEDGDQTRGYGAVSVNDVPHADLEKAFKETNPQLHNIHGSGKITDYTYAKVEGLQWREALPTNTSQLTGNSFTTGDLTLEFKNWGINIKNKSVNSATFTPLLQLVVNNRILYPGFNKPASITKITEDANYIALQCSFGVNSNGAGYDIDTYWEIWIPKLKTINDGNWFAARMTGALNPTQSTYELESIFYSIYTYDKTAIPSNTYTLDINGWTTSTYTYGLFDASHQLGDNAGQEAWIDGNGGQHTVMGWSRPTTMVGAQGFSESGPMAIFLVKPSTAVFSDYDALKTTYENSCFKVDPNFKEPAAWALNPNVQILLKRCLQENVSSNMSMLEKPIIIYPNPMQYGFNIVGATSNVLSYHIYDMKGQVIDRKENKNSTDRMYLPTMNTGVYLIKIMDGKKVYTNKIIVTNK